MVKRIELATLAWECRPLSIASFEADPPCCIRLALPPVRWNCSGEISFNLRESSLVWSKLFSWLRSGDRRLDLMSPNDVHYNLVLAIRLT